MKLIRLSNIVLCCLACGLFSEINAQKALKKQADLFFEKENYIEAFKSYTNYDKLNQDADVLYKFGICNYYVNQPQQCINLLAKAEAMVEMPKEILLYKARSYQDLGDYAKAATLYKNYLHFIKNDAAKSGTIINEIKRCGQSEKLQYLPQIAYVESFGSTVNSPYNERTPVQSPNTATRYYYSSDNDASVGGPRGTMGEASPLAGRYFYDLRSVEYTNGNFNPVAIFGGVQNTERNEYLQGFNRSGNIMYYYKYVKDQDAALVCDTFVGEENRPFSSGRLNSPIQPTKGDKDIAFFNDSTILFASTSYAGYGGYDLFVIHMQSGVWSEPVNLGSEINTPFDEVSPYATLGGNTLFFSSNRLNTYGGYDIFGCQFDLITRKWDTPINMGAPINSTKDDMDPYVTSDGAQLLFSSNRLGGLGQHDIYIAYLKQQISDQFNYSVSFPMLESIPTVEVDSTATEAKIEPPKKSDVPIIQKKFINSPLYYTRDEDVLNAQNLTQIENLKKILEIIPEAKVQIIGHSSLDESAENNIFFTCKRMENVAKYLTTNGISADRIEIVSYGSTYPIVDGSSKLNSRVEFILHSYDSRTLEVTDDQPIMVNNKLNMTYAHYLALKNQLAYKVRFAVTSQMMRNAILNKQNVVSLLKNKSGQYEYYLGYDATYEDAIKTRQIVQAAGFNTSTIVPFINHKEITKEEASALISEYPDLTKYLTLEKK
jgi:outer membrane protein OmpA-like peptidoglycan-associated protein